MDASIANKILDLQDAVAKEPDFFALLTEYQQKSHHLADILETMTKEQKEAVFDCLGVLNEIHIRTLVFAVRK